MKQLPLLLLLFAFSAHSQSLKSIFKTNKWLNDNIRSENLVILHVETSDAYTAGHIPQAQYIGKSEYTTTSVDSLYTQLPSVVYLDSLFRSKGISDNSTVVLYYGGASFAQTFRLYYTFDYLGLSKNVFILDGGLTSWKNAGHALTTDPVQVTPTPAGSITVAINSDILASKDQVKSKANDNNVRIIDARTNEYWSGEKDGDGYYKRPGHIENAKNITWTTILDEDQLLVPKEVLQQFYADQDIPKGSEVITYCHVGLRASVLYTISKGLGYQVSMYDGSINEWDRLDDSYPVEKSN